MTFTINDYILQFNFILEIYFDSQHTEKKHRIVSIEREIPFPSNSERKMGFFSGHSCP